MFGRVDELLDVSDLLTVLVYVVLKVLLLLVLTSVHLDCAELGRWLLVRAMVLLT